MSSLDLTGRIPTAAQARDFLDVIFGKTHPSCGLRQAHHSAHLGREVPS